MVDTGVQLHSFGLRRGDPWVGMAFEASAQSLILHYLSNKLDETGDKVYLVGAQYTRSKLSQNLNALRHLEPVVGKMLTFLESPAALVRSDGRT